MTWTFELFCAGCGEAHITIDLETPISDEQIKEKIFKEDWDDTDGGTCSKCMEKVYADEYADEAAVPAISHGLKPIGAC